MGGDPGAGRLKVDMHVHTRGSFDCLNDPTELLERATARGIDVLCITDHNEVDVALEMRRAQPERIVIGEEVRTAEGVDVIGLFLSEKIPKGTPARETCQRIRAQGGLVYVPHPFAGGKGGGGRILPEIEDVIDAFEGFNARIHDPALNERAVAWARERDIPVGAGSDAHTLHELGRAWVEVEPFGLSAGAFLSALRHGTVHGTSSSRVVHVASTWAKAHKWLIR